MNPARCVASPAVPAHSLALVPTQRWQPDLGYASRHDQVAEETPVALEYNGIPHVVMLATPADLEDFALGFSLTEGLIDHPGDLLQIQRESYPGGGIRLQLQILPACATRLATRSKNLTGRTGCGLCGAEQLAQVFRPLPALPHTRRLSLQALQQALQESHAHQPLQHHTGATHAAFWLDAGGRVVMGREDVGRHNALDKLLGAQARARASATPGHPAAAMGAILITSRASMEMVQKSVQQGVEILLAISAPTALAIDLAQRHGQTLVGFARPGQMTVYTHPQRLFDANEHPIMSNHDTPHHSAQTLVKMAHDIGAFFEAMPDQQQAARDVANHIQRFWEPRMQRNFLDHLAEHPATPLSDIVRQALVYLRQSQPGRVAS